MEGWVGTLPGGGNLSNWFSLTARPPRRPSSWQTDSVTFSPVYPPRTRVHAGAGAHSTPQRSAAHALRNAPRSEARRRHQLFPHSFTFCRASPNYRHGYSLLCTLIALVIRLAEEKKAFYFIIFPRTQRMKNVPRRNV